MQEKIAKPFFASPKLAGELTQIHTSYVNQESGVGLPADKNNDILIEKVQKVACTVYNLNNFILYLKCNAFSGQETSQNLKKVLIYGEFYTSLHSIWACAQQKIPAKCFKICHIFDIRKPMQFFFVFHFMLLQFFP